MTMDGTVRDILGYPLFSLINDARSPAVRAPANAAAGAGIPVRLSLIHIYIMVQDMRQMVVP